MVYVLDIAGIFSVEVISSAMLGIEMPHVILLVMLSLFGLGVLKVNNK
jgi:hypothetical protein